MTKTSKTAAAQTATSEPSALRALVAEWKAANPEETEPADAVRKAEPSPDDKARAGKRSKRAPKTEREDAIQRALEEGLTEEQAEAYARDAATGTAKLPAPRPAPAPKAPPVELDQAPAAAKAAKAARKPAEPKATPTERKAKPATKALAESPEARLAEEIATKAEKPAKQTRTISPERARQIAAMEDAEKPRGPFCQTCEGEGDAHAVGCPKAPTRAVAAEKAEAKKLGRRVAKREAAKAAKPEPTVPDFDAVRSWLDAGNGGSNTTKGSARVYCVTKSAAKVAEAAGLWGSAVEPGKLPYACYVTVSDATKPAKGKKARKPGVTAVRAALSVLVLDPAIRAFLSKHDPKALAQAEAALA